MPRTKSQPSVETPTVDVNELLKQMAEMQKQIEFLKSQQAQPEVKPLTFVPEEDNTVYEIRGDERINVISLVDIQLNLSTRKRGEGGKTFTFRSFGERKKIIYNDLIEIMETCSSFLEDGYFYIADARVIRHHGLDDLYARILNKEKIEQIISGSKDAIDLFKSANDFQKGIIVDILIAKVRENPDAVDANLLMTIGRLASVDIFAKAEESEAIFSENKEEE